MLICEVDKQFALSMGENTTNYNTDDLVAWMREYLFYARKVWEVCPREEDRGEPRWKSEKTLPITLDIRNYPSRSDDNLWKFEKSVRGVGSLWTLGLINPARLTTSPSERIRQRLSGGPQVPVHLLTEISRLTVTNLDLAGNCAWWLNYQWRGGGAVLPNAWIKGMHDRGLVVGIGKSLWNQEKAIEHRTAILQEVFTDIETRWITHVVTELNSLGDQIKHLTEGNEHFATQFAGVNKRYTGTAELKLSQTFTDWNDRLRNATRERMAVAARVP